MQPADIYDCLREPLRLRLVRLLDGGELCVCHLQAVLDEPQVKISKHLAYLKTRGLVSVRKDANWRHYALAPRPPKLLAANLDALRELATTDAALRRDAANLKRLRARLAKNQSASCC